MNVDLGKLKRTTNEKCPVCNKPLQIRAKNRISFGEEGEEISTEIEYIQCSSCDYSENMRKDRKEKKKKENWR